MFEAISVLTGQHQCVTRHSLEHALIFCQPFSGLLVVLPPHFPQPWKGPHKRALPGIPTAKQIHRQYKYIRQVRNPRNRPLASSPHFWTCGVQPGAKIQSFETCKMNAFSVGSKQNRIRRNASYSELDELACWKNTSIWGPALKRWNVAKWCRMNQNNNECLYLMTTLIKL
jgi:hypothetical protein